MARSPQYKVYRGSEYVAACKYPEGAAMLCSALGDGTTVRLGHRQVIWTEGELGNEASYDDAASLMFDRESMIDRERRQLWRDRGWDDNNSERS